MHGWRRLATGLALAGMVTALASGCASRSGSASGTRSVAGSGTAAGTGSAAGAGAAAGGGATAGTTATGKPGGSVPAFDKEWLTAETDSGKKIPMGSGRPSLTARGGKGHALARKAKIVGVTLPEPPPPPTLLN